MRIGIDISQSVFLGTGVAAYTRNLTQALITLGGEEYVLFGASLRRQKELLEFMRTLPTETTVHSKFYALPPSLLSILWNKLHILSIDRLIGKVDILHTSDWTEPPTKIPKVTTIHDLIMYKYPETLPEEIVENHKARFKWVKKESEAVIADSESTKQDIIEYLDIPEKKIHVVYLGVTSEYYPKKIDEVLRVKKKYNIRGDYVLSIGTREPRKNLARTVLAFNKIKNPEATLVIGGNFGWGEDIANSKNVQVLGFVDQKDLPALYTGATCFVYPSLYEGFGLPILEALACGVPVVTSNRGSLGEIADKVSVEVHPESVDDISRGIEYVLELGKKEYKALSLKGIELAQRFTWAETARKTLAVYKKII